MPVRNQLIWKIILQIHELVSIKRVIKGKRVIWCYPVF